MFDLKPCPFCGGEAELKTGIAPKVLMNGASFAKVKCIDCCAITDEYFDLNKDGSFIINAITAWNTRHDEASIVVHCKDCKYATHWYDTGSITCKRSIGIVEMYPDDFCSKGIKESEE